MSGIEAAELRSPLGAQDTCGAVQDSWFSGASASSDTDAGCTPASLAGDSMWAEEATGKHRVSQPSVTKPMAGVGSGDGGFVEGGGAEQFREFNCKVTVDDFEILHMIGEGGFGKVYQVRQRNRLDPACKTGRVLAMKCMRKDAVLADNLKGTKNERSILSRLRHPFIVTMHFAFQCKGRLYLIMDYFPGGQFLDMLHKNSPFSDEAVKVYSGEIFLALKELHANGIVHRDLKPENILVDAAGHLVVTDFGCSKIDDNSDGPVRSKSWAGTELYMAPEQLAGKEYGREVDWWALGVLVWEMVTGDHPFYHKNRKQIHNNILKKKLNLPSYHPQVLSHAHIRRPLSLHAALAPSTLPQALTGTHAALAILRATARQRTHLLRVCWHVMPRSGWVQSGERSRSRSMASSAALISSPSCARTSRLLCAPSPRLIRSWCVPVPVCQCLRVAVLRAAERSCFCFCVYTWCVRACVCVSGACAWCPMSRADVKRLRHTFPCRMCRHIRSDTLQRRRACRPC